MRNLFPINDESYKLFEEFGFSREDFYNLSEGELEKLMNGRMTSLLPVRMKNANGEEVEQMARLGFIKNRDGSVKLKAYPARKEIQLEGLNLSKRDLKKLKEQGVIYTELKINDKRNRYFVQLDPLTNCLMYAKADDIGQCIPTSLHGTDLTHEQRAKIWEGKPVEVKVGQQIFIVGVDLERPSGFKVWRVEK